MGNSTINRKQSTINKKRQISDLRLLTSDPSSQETIIQPGEDVFDGKVEADHQEDHKNGASTVEKGIDGGLDQGAGTIFFRSFAAVSSGIAASHRRGCLGRSGVGISGVTITGVAVGGSEVGVMVGVGETSVVGVGEGRALPTKTLCVVNSS